MNWLMWLAVVLAVSPVSAADFYIAPLSGSPGGDGNRADPWRTLEEVWESGLTETRHWSTLPYEEGATLEVINPGAPPAWEQRS